MSSIPLQMECHRIIKRKGGHRKVFIWQPTLFTVWWTFLFNLLITRSNQYITSVNPVWSTVVMVEPTIDLCGKYPCDHLFRWTQIFTLHFFPFRYMICQSLRISYPHSVALPSIIQGMKQSDLSTVSPHLLILIIITIICCTSDCVYLYH